MTQKRPGCLPIVLVLALVVSVIFNIAVLMPRKTRSGHGALKASATSKESPFGEEIVKAEVPSLAGNDKKVAVISLRGVISSAEPGQVGESTLDDTLEELHQAKQDANVSAVLLRIDSPGGEVTASDILYQAVREVREKKPVVVSMGSVAASGGYYVACAGSHLFAHDTTITASIGVIMQALNYQQLLSKVGLHVETFKSGALKDLLNGARELTEAERAYVQGMINQSYDRFVGIVAKERHLDEQGLRGGIADGRIVSGTDALKAQLIDEIGGFDQALQKARDLGKTPGAPAVRYTAPMAFGRLMRLLSQAPMKGTKVEVEWGQTALRSRLENGRLYYLPSILVP